MKKIIEVPHFVQFYNIEDNKWQERSCGIVSLAMILDFYSLPCDLDRLIDQGLRLDGYIKGIGWKHQVIVSLAKKYGLKAYRAEDESPENLLKELDQNRPVIISVHKDFDSQNGGHLIVLCGYCYQDDELLGFYVNDPVGPQFKHKYQFIEINKFLAGWKKRAIYLCKSKKR